MAYHLGGHLGITHIDEGILNYLISEFKIKSFLDIGCGPMGMVNLAKQKGLYALGIDGDPKLAFHDDFLKHDFTLGEPTLNADFDLAWSVEFLEHVEEKYISNFMPSFKRCKFAFITHALPNKPGHHHVNCQPPEYWIDIFQKNNFQFEKDTTDILKQVSTMRREFVKNTGKFFVNKNII